MNTIIPAIIPQSFDHLTEALREAFRFTNEVQIDIVDGAFVPFMSWPYRGSGSVMRLREYTQLHILEIDLMIEAPEEAVVLYAQAGVQKIVVHLESVTNLAHIRSTQAQYGFELGLSIRNDTSLTVLTNALIEGEYVQLMGIREIGTQGQPFDTAVLTRIAELRGTYSELTISIDGSVNGITLPELRTAGANRFVAGSAIFGTENPEAAFANLTLL